MLPAWEDGLCGETQCKPEAQNPKAASSGSRRRYLKDPVLIAWVLVAVEPCTDPQHTVRSGLDPEHRHSVEPLHCNTKGSIKQRLAVWCSTRLRHLRSDSSTESCTLPRAENGDGGPPGWNLGHLSDTSLSSVHVFARPQNMTQCEVKARAVLGKWQVRTLAWPVPDRDGGCLVTVW